MVYRCCSLLVYPAPLLFLLQVQVLPSRHSFVSSRKPGSPDSLTPRVSHDSLADSALADSGLDSDDSCSTLGSSPDTSLPPVAWPASKGASPMAALVHAAGVAALAASKKAQPLRVVAGFAL